MKAFDSLMNIQRFGALINDHEIINENIKEKCEESINTLQEISQPLYDVENLSNERIRTIQRYINKYESTPFSSLNKIFNNNEKMLIQVLFNLDKLTYQDKKLSEEDSKDFVDKVFQAISPSMLNIASEKLLHQYLCSVLHEFDNLKENIIKIYKKKDINDPTYLEDISLFVSPKAFRTRLYSASSRASYEATLNGIGIPTRFVKDTYFVRQFYYWAMTKGPIKTKTLQVNYYYFKNLVRDEKILIMAKYITSFYTLNRTNLDRATELFTELNNKIEINSKLDMTEEEFWILVDNDYKTEDNEQLVKNAYKYSKLLLDRTIITQFFDILCEDLVSKQRANFWRSYVSSSKFEELKIILTPYQKICLLDEISVKQQEVLNNYIILNTSTNQYESPVILLIFENKVIVEYTHYGNSVQVFNRENFDRIYNLYRVGEVGRVPTQRIFKISHAPSYLDSYVEEGKIVHTNSGYSSTWTLKTRDRLEDEGISPNF